MSGTLTKNRSHTFVIVIILLNMLGFPGQYEKVFGSSISMLFQYGIFLLMIALMLGSSGNTVYDVKLINAKREYALIYLMISTFFISSMVVTNFPKEQVISCLRFSVTILFALWLAEHYQVTEILELLYKTECVLLLLIFAFMAIRPDLAFETARYDETCFMGIYDAKNTSGFVFAHGVLGQLCLLKNKKEEHQKISIIFLAVFIIQAVFLFLSRATGAMVTVVAVYGYLIFWERFQNKQKRLPLGFIYTSVSIIFVFASMTILDFFAPLIIKLGKNPTLTGRTILWEQIINMMQKTHTMFGYGFNMFWRDEAAYSSLHAMFHKESWFNSMTTGAHNLVLELWLEVGLVGIAVFFLAVLFSFRKIRQATNAEYRFIVVYMISIMFEGLVERVYSVSNYKVLLLFVSMAIGCRCAERCNEREQEAVYVRNKTKQVVEAL